MEPIHTLRFRWWFLQPYSQSSYMTFRFWLARNVYQKNAPRGHHVQIGTFGISGDDLLQERWIDANFWNEIFGLENRLGLPFFFGFPDLKGLRFFYLYDGWKIRDHNKRTWYIQHIPRFCSNKDQLWMYNEKPTLCFCCFSKLTGCKPSSKNLWNRRGKPPKKGDPIDSVKTNLRLGFWNESDVMKLVKYIDIRCIDVIPIYHIYICKLDCI